MYNQVKMIKLLQNNKADISIKDNDGKTALDYAKEKGFEAIIDCFK
jgi:ankyrin repeat protein